MKNSRKKVRPIMSYIRVAVSARRIESPNLFTDSQKFEAFFSPGAEKSAY